MSFLLSDETNVRLGFLTSLLTGMTNLVAARVYPSLRPYLPQSPTHLANKNAIITGGNSGIGLQIAKDLVQLGANVTLGCRSLSRGEKAVNEILELNPTAQGRVHLLQLDTSSLSSVRDFTANYVKAAGGDGAKVDILANNAGIGMLPPNTTSEFSTDGYELLYATNFLGSFLLTHLLEPYLTDDARVIMTSSTGQFQGKIVSGFSTTMVKNHVELGFHDETEAPSKGSRGQPRYSMTKSMQCAFARSLQAKWDQEAATNGVANTRVAHSFTPGYTSTAIFGKYKIEKFFEEPIFAFLQLGLVFATDVSEGAATGSWLSSTKDAKVAGIGQGGHYWDRMVKRTCTADLFNQDLLDRMWTRWEADAGVTWR